MQRSPETLLHGRVALDNSVSGKRQWCRVSLSVVLISWGIFLLLISLIGRGNSYGDGLGAVVGESTKDEVESTDISDSGNSVALEEAEARIHNQSSHIQNFVIGTNDTELVTREKDEDNGSPNVKEQASGETPYLEVKGENKIPPQSDKSPSVAQEEQISKERSDSEVIEETIIPPSHVATLKEQASEESSLSVVKVESRIPSRSDKLSRVAPTLDEFRSKTLTVKEKHGAGQAGSVTKRRVEPGGKEYNYASASKGAKVLAFNKEAKGASNILDKDKDKYLRNPCSVEDKHVIVELSEETLVDTIELANFEHYSSNLKNFEVLSSLIYPTDSWNKMGNFTAANTKHAQRFFLQEPKWARYLKINLLSHYGSEFYCTLSAMGVYGVDAVETMLEDLISVPENRFGSEELISEQPSLLDATEDDLYNEFLSEMYLGSGKETTNTRQETSKINGADSAAEARPPQVKRLPGDTVLKILMQKVRQLDVGSAVLERYLEDLNNRYGKIFKDIDNEIADKDLILEQIISEIKTLRNSQLLQKKDTRDLFTWKSIVSSQLARLVEDNAILRSEVEVVRNNQIDMENRSLAVILISFIFGCFAAIMVVVDLLLSVCRKRKSDQFHRPSSGWIMLLLSSCIVTLIIVL